MSEATKHMSDRPKSRRILPRDKGAAPLDVVIGVMAFLATLALGASLLANRQAESWRAGLADRLTVQILAPDHPTQDRNMDSETDAALQILRGTDGIVTAIPMSQKEESDLVSPWIGSDAMVKDLPLPQLIDATIEPGRRINLAELTARIKAVVPDANVDDHTRWTARLQSLADTIIWSAYAILALIAVGTAAAVSFATRAGLDAHHDIVELLHGMGAHSGFIARAFEWHYFLATLGAAAAGAFLAALIFLAAGGLEFAGVEAVPFLPPLALNPMELAWLAAVPLVAGMIALATARLSVLAALREIY
jgi:cell division transport system permease protein